MSTPLLDPYHFAITAHSLGHHAAHGRTSKFSESLAARLCDNLGVPVFGHDDGQPENAAARLMFDLRRINATAHAARYGDPVPPVPPLTVAINATPLDPVALLKALQCIRYNCDGGEAIGKSFQSSLAIVDAVIDTVRNHIIDGLPAYQAADWFLEK